MRDDDLRAEIARIRQQPLDPELDQKIRKEVEELAVAGKIHRFKIERRCRVCQDDMVRKLVNGLLARGFSIASILDALEPINAQREANRQITRNSLFTHRKQHFPLDQPAAAVYRKMLEEEAERNGQDWIEGVGSQINVFSFLQAVRDKSFESIVAEDAQVTVGEGMQAALKLHELLKEESDAAQVAELYQKLNVVIQAVKDVVPQELFSKIIGRIEAYEQGILDVEAVDQDELEQ